MQQCTHKMKKINKLFFEKNLSYQFQSFLTLSSINHYDMLPPSSWKASTIFKVVNHNKFFQLHSSHSFPFSYIATIPFQPSVYVTCFFILRCLLFMCCRPLVGCAHMLLLLGLLLRISTWHLACMLPFFSPPKQPPIQRLT